MSAPKRRKLSDLFQAGRDLVLDDGQGEPLTVYIKKLSPIELEGALRAANAVRARYYTALKDETSTEYTEVYASSVEMLTERDQCLDLILDQAMASRYLAVEAELADEEGWKDHDYLQGLFDSWNDGLKDEDPEENPDAKRVADEIKRFRESVNNAIGEAREETKITYDTQTTEQLSQKALDLLLKARADNAWLNELRLSELYAATRDPNDHKKRFLASRDEVNELSSEVVREILDCYRELMVDIAEGKDLPVTPAS